jgi:hypothetical protein
VNPLKKHTINLQDYRTSGANVFIGRPRGEKVRRLSKIDDVYLTNDIIEIIIPDDIASINPSFLEEFLENVVKKLGVDGFKKKFVFVNNGQYKINIDLDDAIDRILRTETALN